MLLRHGALLAVHLRQQWIKRNGEHMSLEGLPGLNHRNLAAALLEVILAAGRIELGYYHTGVEVETKADDSPVTKADQEAEAVILAALARIAPEIPVVAEEAASAGQIPDVGTRFFLVDPLDGTREFIHQRDEFTVNIALIEAGVAVFGMVYAPALEMLYVTLAADQAAEAKIAADAADVANVTLESCGLQPIHCRKMDMSGLTVVASRSHSNEETEAFLAKYEVRARTSAGSSLKFCVLARGDADLYPRLAPTMEWDTAAGHAVLAAAGGSVTTVDGGAFRYGKAAAGFLNPGFVAWGRHADE